MNASNESKSVYGAQFYLQEHGSVYIPYFAISTMCIVFGTIGNSVIITTILFNKKLRVNPAYMLMTNLALSDLGISLFVHTFTDVGIYMGEDYYAQRHGLCTFLATFCLVSCGSSLLNMGILAVNRYINICCHNFYKKAFTFKKTIAFCVSTWIVGLLFDIPNFVGWGGHFFDPKSADCVLNRLASQSYTLFFAISAIFVPCLCIFICYLRIFIFAFHSKSRIGTGHEMAQSLRVARSLFASFALFAICWVPYGVIVSVDYGDEMPMSIHASVTLMAHINSTLNPVLYILFNPVFRASFYDVTRQCLRLRTRPVAENNENTTKLHLSLTNHHHKIPESADRAQTLNRY